MRAITDWNDDMLSNCPFSSNAHADCLRIVLIQKVIAHCHSASHFRKLMDSYVEDALLSQGKSIDKIRPGFGLTTLVLIPTYSTGQDGIEVQHPSCGNSSQAQ